MPDKLILDFPILQMGSGDFKPGVAYEVESETFFGNIVVTHTLNGQSFIRKLIENGKASFSVSLLYRDSAERQACRCDGKIIPGEDKITAKQEIPMGFSYAPEVLPSIILLNDTKIKVDDSSGLTDFWKAGEEFSISLYSRIALHPKLKFTGGEVSHLFQLKIDEELKNGEIRVDVNEYSMGDEAPVTVDCGKDVFHELKYLTLEPPKNPVEAMRWAIFTQVLCAFYAYMKNLHITNPDCEESGVLQDHLRALESKTNESWKNENFNPSLAATKMWPYFVRTPIGGNND